MDESLVVTL